MLDLWYQRHRPQTIDDYVWRDAAQRRRAEAWIAAGALPHLLFSGPSGVGKTAQAQLLLRCLDIPAADILRINASRERRIDEIVPRIQEFITTWADQDNPSGIKYVELEEADSLSVQVQKSLRDDMQTFAESCRFILTCNYPNKIIPALHDRCQHVVFGALDRADCYARMGAILDAEAVAFTPATLDHYIDRAYPSLRKCLNLLQENSTGGHLLPPPSETDESDRDYIIEMVGLFREQRFIEARHLIVAQAAPEEYADIYRYLYHNLALFGTTQRQQDDALLIIARGVRDHNLTADIEINLAATLVELTRDI